MYVVIHDPIPDHAELLGPADVGYVGRIESISQLLDVCTQIKAFGQSGYKLIYNGGNYPIDANGRCSWPDTLFESERRNLDFLCN